MENTSNQKASQAEMLPPGIFVGVIPPDGTQLSMKLWQLILEIDDVDRDALLKQLRKDKVPLKRYCKNPFIDATHIRQNIFCGKEDAECPADEPTAKDRSSKKKPGGTA